MSYSTPDSAVRYLNEETNFTQQAKVGLGAEFINNYVRSKMANVDVGGALDKVGMGTYASGMEFSGIGNKLSANVLGKAAGMMSQAEVQANDINQKAKVNAQNIMLQLAQHQDNMQLETDKLNSQGGGLFGALTTGLSIASSLEGLGAFKHLGGLKKFFGGGESAIKTLY